jgi:hypothetical protein
LDWPELRLPELCCPEALLLVVHCSALPASAHQSFVDSVMLEQELVRRSV